MSETVECLVVGRLKYLPHRVAVGATCLDGGETFPATILFAQQHVAIGVGEPHFSGGDSHRCVKACSAHCYRVIVLRYGKFRHFLLWQHNEACRIGKPIVGSGRNPYYFFSHHLQPHHSCIARLFLLHFNCHPVCVERVIVAARNQAQKQPREKQCSRYKFSCHGVKKRRCNHMIFNHAKIVKVERNAKNSLLIFLIAEAHPILLKDSESRAQCKKQLADFCDVV